MSELLSTRLNYLAVLSVSGKDAIKFLQGQCTQDVAKQGTGTAAASAFCTAKGRMVTNVQLFKRDEDCIWLICHATSAPILQAHLSKYIAFFRGTELKHEADLYQGYGVNAALFQLLENQGALQAASVHFKLGDDLHYIWLSPKPENKPLKDMLVENELNDSRYWQCEEIKQIQLWLDESQVEAWVPQNVSLDDMNGISFTKGCYTGQEVIARLHYKGQSKKRLFAVSWNADSNSSNKLYAQGKPIGELITQITYAQGHVGLAVLKTDSLDQAIYRDENQHVTIELLN